MHSTLEDHSERTLFASPAIKFTILPTSAPALGSSALEAFSFSAFCLAFRSFLDSFFFGAVSVGLGVSSVVAAVFKMIPE